MAIFIPPELKAIVTFIFLADSKGNLLRDPNTEQPVANGTGFFVGIDGETDKAKFFGYLVTAQHVLKDSKGNSFAKVYLRLNKISGDAEFVSLDLKKDETSLIFTSVDPTVDLAVIPCFPPTDMFDFKMLKSDMLTTKESFKNLHIAEGSDIFFMGLYASYYGERRNNPIVRFGRVAMFPEEPIKWQDYPSDPPQNTELYLLETQSYGGNSGSPVFFSLGADRKPGSLTLGSSVIMLAGVMKGSFNELSPINLIPAINTGIAVSKQNNGIAAAIPSYLLHDILFSDALKKYRADFITANKVVDN